ncbi:hypothetical protein [Streptomyces sp. NBC_01643]|uniref:hypothetical protein n=1 Tax=Streptomyces sp. NBC_01643 TaxID=2975906 RepID=UPI003866D53D|nr:hypothetical protein OHB03_30600 [Streptomyces sp. NBC_01643]
MLAAQERVLAADHPDTLETRHYLAWFRAKMGHVATAVREFTHLSERLAESEGPHAIAARRAREALTHWQGRRRT